MLFAVDSDTYIMASAIIGLTGVMAAAIIAGILGWFGNKKATNGKGFDPHTQPAGTMAVEYWESIYDKMTKTIEENNKLLKEIKDILQKPRE